MTETAKEIIQLVIKKYLNSAKFVRLYYVKGQIEGTIKYLQDCLRKAKEEGNSKISEKEITTVRSLPLQLLNTIGRELDRFMRGSMINLLERIEAQGYVTPEDVMQLLQVRRTRVRESLRPLLERKVLQVVTLPRPEFKSSWGRGYGWFGDTTVHDFLMQQVYQHLDKLQVGVEVEHSFAYNDKLGKECTKITDGKIIVNGDTYLLEVYTNVETKKGKIIDELRIYGNYVEVSPKVRSIIFITEKKRSKYALLRFIRQYAKEFRHNFSVFHYSRSGLKELSNFFLTQNKYYGQRNKT